MRETWHTEESWLAELKEALDEAAEVPPEVIAAGHAAWTWRTIDLELAQLTYDSRTDELPLTSRRTPEAGIRSLTLTSASLTIELEIEPSTILGQIIPAGDVTSLTVSLVDGTNFAVDIDDMGCFTVAPIPEKAFRLQLTGEKSIATDWISI